MCEEISQSKRRGLGWLVGPAMTVLVLSGCAAEIDPPEPGPGPTQSLNQQITAVEEQIVSKYLDNAWRNVVSIHPDAIRPEVDRVRLIHQTDWTTIIPDCLAEMGHHVEPDANGSWSVQGGPESEPYFVAFYTCEAMYPVHPKYNAPMTDAKIAKLYDYFLNSLKPCLEAEGYAVPPAPSLQRFQETYRTDGGWFIYAGVADAAIGTEELARINRVCPQVPENFIG